jgi:para-aminobenzoate synthetase/4-amino-4-deoxychorismate lyase
MYPCARFDDLTPGAEQSFALLGLQDAVVARRLDDVVPALQRVDELTARGLWAGGFVAYEAAPAFDPALQVKARLLTDPFRHVPLVWFGIFARREDVDPLVPRQVHPAPYHASAWVPDCERAEYDASLKSISEYIASGETYQVNHTFRLRAAFSGDPFELYRDLVLAQRGSHAACFDTGRHYIVSASPERFFRLSDRRIDVRPMKGTAARGRWLNEDLALSAQLIASEKDQAENLMIVDLIRNDLGRIAQFGTVTVEQLLALERYETVWQLTSQITAALRDDVGLSDVFAALFPSGSVTGAPKARTMEIIAELEPSPRGVYCGAMGYVSPPDEGFPRANFNVAIRTVTVDEEEGLAEYGVGGGITWDSVAEAEYEEARLKAALLVERRPNFALLETIRWEDGEGFFWLEEHLERLAASAEYFAYDYDEAKVRAALDEAVAAAEGRRVVRLQLARGGKVAVDVAGETLPPMNDEDGAPLRVALSDTPVSSRHVFLFHKTTNRRVYGSRALARPDVDDVILVNERGEVTETTTANVVIRSGDEWVTTPLDCGLLGGVYRRILLEAGDVTERVVEVEELGPETELAVVNSVRGWRPALLEP